MSGFASTLTSLNGLSALALDLEKHVPVEPEMRTAARKVAEMFELPTRPSEEELLRALRAFASWCDGGRGPSSDQWLLAPWICLQGQPRLLDREMFATELDRRIAAEKQPRLLRAMLHSYLRDWEDGSAATAKAGEVIRRELRRHSAAWAVRWRERATIVSLFEAKGVTERIADAAISSGGDVRQLLRDLGFTTELLTHSGLHHSLASTVTAKLSLELANNPSLSGATVSNLLAFLRQGNTLRFPALRVDLAELLLAPFATRDLANVQGKAALLLFFDELYGDPRSHAKAWAGISQNARRTITRWLARKALDLFFDILSATADPIWRWRKAFWLALERKGVIDEAWPVFGREALDWLARNAEQRRRVSAHARLTRAERKQSVMLMRIGQYVVAEWSHAGAVRIWGQDDERAPDLNRRIYTADEVREDCLHDQRHDGTERYSWQSELSDWLAKRIGVRVSINEMRPYG